MAGQPVQAVAENHRVGLRRHGQARPRVPDDEGALDQLQGELLGLEDPAVLVGEHGEQHAAAELGLDGGPVDVEEARVGRARPVLQHVQPPGVGVAADPHVVGNDVEHDPHVKSGQGGGHAVEGVGTAKLGVERVVVGDVVAMRAARARLEARGEVGVADPEWLPGTARPRPRRRSRGSAPAAGDRWRAARPRRACREWPPTALRRRSSRHGSLGSAPAARVAPAVSGASIVRAGEARRSGRHNPMRQIRGPREASQIRGPRARSMTPAIIVTRVRGLAEILRTVPRLACHGPQARWTRDAGGECVGRAANLPRRSYADKTPGGTGALPAGHAVMRGLAGTHRDDEMDSGWLRIRRSDGPAGGPRPTRRRESTNVRLRT